MDLLVKIKNAQPDLEVLLLTAHGSIDTAILAMKLGAYDYLTKPFHLPELEIHVQKALEKVHLARRQRLWVEHIRFESPRYQLLGSSQAMAKVRQMIEKVAPADATVLVRGLSGTGKELVARALHYNSPRRDNPLVSVNCASLQESLLESELFGYEKGAFTGAQTSKVGLFEVAEGGSLFIDEVAEMAPGLQAKLLRVLDNDCFRRVGGTQELKVNVRLIAATNKNLEEEQKNGRFRDDLFYRLNVVTVFLPLLRERKGDIPQLVEHFLTTRQVAGKKFGIQPEALAALEKYSWPGNVRELANVLERAQILAEENTLTLDDLPESIIEAELATAPGLAPADSLLLRDVERHHIELVLTREKWNKVQAAKVLGVSCRALYRLIEKFRLELPRDGEPALNF